MSASVQHVEAIVKHMADLSLAETRQLYSTLRLCEFEDGNNDVLVGNALLPVYGVTVSDIGLAYVLNTSRSTSRSTSQSTSQSTSRSSRR